MTKRLLAIGFIFVCTSIAWFILSAVTTSRTFNADSSLRTQVESIWGAPQMQSPPAVWWTERTTQQVQTVEDGKTITKPVERRIERFLPLAGSDIDVGITLDHRQKGLLWYSTYGVNFAGRYSFTNETGAAREVEVALPFPAKNAVFGDLVFELEEKPWAAAPVTGNDRITARVQLAPGERVVLKTGYRSQGLDRWTYQFGSGVSEVRE